MVKVAARAGSLGGFVLGTGDFGETEDWGGTADWGDTGDSRENGVASDFAGGFRLLHPTANAIDMTATESNTR